MRCGCVVGWFCWVVVGSFVGWLWTVFCLSVSVCSCCFLGVYGCFFRFLVVVGCLCCWLFVVTTRRWDLQIFFPKNYITPRLRFPKMFDSCLPKKIGGLDESSLNFGWKHVLPSGKLTWQWKTTIFLIGDTSSHAGFSIAMLVYQSVTGWLKPPS